MSRIGKKPITLPAGVTATIKGAEVTVKGPKGSLTRVLPTDMTAALDGNVVTVSRPSDENRHKSLHGLSRTLIANLVVGYSHPVEVRAPEGIKLVVETPTLVRVEGINKELVGQVAAEIRNVRPPEPYKGKGIRYVGEFVRRKAGKTGAK